MEIIKNDAEKATMKFTIENLFFLSQAFNEICHGISVPDFELKIGTNKEGDKRLLRAVQALIYEMESSSQDSHIS